MNDVVKCLVKLTTSKYSALVLYLCRFGPVLSVPFPFRRRESTVIPEVGGSLSSRNVFTTVKNFIITAMRDNFLFNLLLFSWAGIAQSV